jgi:protein SCO1/2
MSFRRNARFGTIHQVLLWGGGVTVALGLAVSAIALGSSEQDDDDAISHNHAAERPAGHTLHAAEQNANGSLDSISGEADPHAHHRRMLEKMTYSRSLHSYDLPDPVLVDMKGENTSLLNEVNRGQPVMLNFIFTTCTTICPVLSASFSQVQQQLGAERDQVRMVSITIDPEHDTPARLRAYAARYHAGPQWQFLTGNLDDIVSIQKAFGAFRGTKVNHEPFTFLRATPASPWVRLDGLANAADIIKEYRQLVAEQEASR